MRNHDTACGVVAALFLVGVTAGLTIGNKPESPIEVADSPQVADAMLVAADEQQTVPAMPWLSTARRRAIFRQIGTASWYGKAFEGKPMANTLPFKRRMMTAAHRTLPLGTKLRIVNLENGHVVEVTVTDRGPYVPGRVIDLSEMAATRLGMRENGIAQVSIEAVEVPDKLG